MRAGLSTIQQTLTPEAANVLNLSIAEAGRRNHGQTTPLHVADTLLASPSGFLRQACISSHPNSSHPLQCRALELCFRVALERLPTAQNLSPGMEPPISNALMAALKRAQAHQRRGCPEQQQQPLLAVKVELDQLIISILDDPSVSRVMREASFSSPAVKATVEQSLLNSQASSTNANPSLIGVGFRPTPTPMPIPSRNLYLNPRLQQGNLVQQPGHQRNDEIKRVVDVLSRTRKKNPVLVGESEPEAVMKEILRRIEKGELGEGLLKNVQVITIEKEIFGDKSLIPLKLKELGGLIESRIGSSNGGGGGIIVDLGDLKWLVEQPVSLGILGSGGVQQQQQQHHHQVVSETGRAAVAEMAKLLTKLGEGSNGRVWLIGTATCETFLRCQVYHPTMENDWDLQAVPIASRSPVPGLFPRLGNNGILSTSVETLNPLKSLPTGAITLTRRVPENLDPARRTSCCPQCSENYEQELAELVAEECEKSSELKAEASRSSLPQWLHNAKSSSNDGKLTDQSQSKYQEVVFKQKSQELQKKWSDTCLHVHPDYHKSLGSERIVPTPFSMTGVFNPNPLLRQPLQPTRNLGQALLLNSNQVVKPALVPTNSPPRSPVRTDLALGPTKVTEPAPQKTDEERVKDFLGCISSEPPASKFASELDADSFKKLLKGLMEKAWWQPEAASAVASAVTRCKAGNGRRRGAGARGDAWLLFTGPDRVGKKKIASVVSEQICGASPIMICLGSRREDEETENIFRGKTSLDRIVEAVRRNPFSVIMLQDIDEADILIRGSIKKAMERGRLADSHGREISLGNVIFILTGNWSTVNPRSQEHCIDEKKLASTSCGFRFRLIIGERSAKRRANWLHDEDRPTRCRKEISSGPSFDLNLAADAEDDRTDGSHNSSDLTVDHEVELGLENRQFSITSVPHELISSADDVIIFKSADFAFIRREIRKTIAKRFSIVLEDMLSIEVDDDAVECILGGLWHGRSSLEEWAEKVLAPSFQRLKDRLPSDGLASADKSTVARLVSDSGTDSDNRSNAVWLPGQITILVD